MAGSIMTRVRETWPATPKPINDNSEQARLDALRSYEIMDTPPEEAFNRVVELAQTLFDAPIALVSFLDEDRQWFKARIGLLARDNPREYAFCDYTIRQDDVFIIPDTTADPRFADNPLVANHPHLRFYAGAPMITPDGARIGTVCVIDYQPRDRFSELDRKRLASLAGIASNELELRQQVRRAAELVREKDLLAREMGHRIRSTLRLMTFVLQAQARRTESAAARQALYEAADRVTNVELVHQQLHHGSAAFRMDARAYLMALLGGLQDSVVDERAGRTVALHMAEDLAVTPDRLPALGMVMVELVTNALKHGRGAVQAWVDRDGGDVVVRVADEGHGFRLDEIGTPRRLGLQLVGMLGLPGSLSVSPSRPQLVSVRLAA